jgi:hypothetical protein
MISDVDIFLLVLEILVRDTYLRPHGSEELRKAMPNLMIAGDFVSPDGVSAGMAPCAPLDRMADRGCCQRCKQNCENDCKQKPTSQYRDTKISL